MLTNIRPAVVYFGGGRLDEKGELDERTQLKLKKVLEAGSFYKNENRPYVYVFSCGRPPGHGGQRPCDVLRVLAFQNDPHCHLVIVPEAEENLLTDIEKWHFFRESTQAWRGSTTNIN